MSSYTTNGGSLGGMGVEVNPINAVTLNVQGGGALDLLKRGNMG